MRLMTGVGPLRTDLHATACLIARELPTYNNRPRWRVYEGTTPSGAVEMTDTYRTVFLSHAPGSDPTDPNTTLVQAAVRHPFHSHLKAERTDLTGRLLTNPQAAAHQIARTLLVVHDVHAYPTDMQEDVRRQDISSALLEALPDHSTTSVGPHWDIEAALPNGAALSTNVAANLSLVGLNLTDVPLPAAVAALHALLPRRVSPPRPHGRRPEELRVRGRAARALATLFPLEPETSAVGNSGEERFYTVCLHHTGSPLVHVTIAAGASGRSTTRVDLYVTCGVDTAALTIRALRAV